MHDLIAFQTGFPSGMKLAASPRARDWMDNTSDGFARRCLPMGLANQAGWLILNDRPIRAKWTGHAHPSAIAIECEGEAPFGAISHFGHGVLTFLIPFLFRTPPGVAVLFRGPANMPKDGIAPLEALVETDWAVAGASVNWKFTRTDTWVEFARDEPICMIVPQRLDQLEAFQPGVIDIARDPDTHKAYAAWNRTCKDFNDRLRAREPEAVQMGWLRNYFRGTAPHVAPEPVSSAGGHRTKLRLREFDGVAAGKPVQPPAPAGADANGIRAGAGPRDGKHRSPALQALGMCPYSATRAE
jgi:hypothetical protein